MGYNVGYFTDPARLCGSTQSNEVFVSVLVCSGLTTNVQRLGDDLGQ